MARKDNRRGDLAGNTASDEFGYYVPKKHWGSRLAPYASEWAGWAVSWPVAFGAHEWVGTDPVTLPWASAGLSLLGAGLTALTWRCAKARAAITRQFATATTGITAAWMVTSTIEGPTGSPLLELWAFGGAGVALAWSIHKALKRGGDEQGQDALFEKVQLAGVRSKSVEVAPNKVTTQLQLPKGEMEVSDVQKAKHRIAGFFGLGKSAVRVTENPDDTSQATMTIVPNDVLKKPSSWPGPSSPGGSITEALIPGLYEDAESVQLFLPGDRDTHRNATHFAVIGMNGSGKSHGAKLGWTEILTRRDAGLVVLDPSKGEQSVSFLGDAPYKVVTGVKDCRKTVKKLPNLITERASQLGKWGYDQWVPEAFELHGLPYLVVWIEEAPRVLEDAKTLTRIAQEARSAGISLVLSLQKPSFRQMNTDIRSQLGGVWCFGVNDLDDAAYLLSEDSIEGGARPDQWKNRRPGCDYLEGPGIDETRFTTPARTFDAADEDLAADIAAHEDIRPGVHPIDAKGLELAADAESPTTTTPAASVVDEFDDEDDDGLGSLADLDPLEAEDFDDEDLPEVPDNPEPDLNTDDEDELPEDTALVQFAQTRPTREEALRMLRTHITELAQAGTTEFTIRDLPDPQKTYGRGRSWLSGELDKLAGPGGLLARAGERDRATAYRLRHTQALTDTHDDYAA